MISNEWVPCPGCGHLINPTITHLCGPPPEPALTRTLLEDIDAHDAAQALRVAALERDLESVRAQRDKAVEALREIGKHRCEDRHDWCSKEEAPREDWFNPCIARAVLAAGVTESEDLT